MCNYAALKHILWAKVNTETNWTMQTEILPPHLLQEWIAEKLSVSNREMKTKLALFFL
jgi:hypothetical protein